MHMQWQDCLFKLLSQLSIWGRWGPPYDADTTHAFTYCFYMHTCLLPNVLVPSRHVSENYVYPKVPCVLHWAVALHIDVAHHAQQQQSILHTLYNNNNNNNPYFNHISMP